MKIYSDTKFFVLCPGNLYTGGPLELHQLASSLISFGFDAQMCYVDHLDNPVHPELKKFHLPYTFKFDDKPHNIVIVPESLFLKKQMKSQVIIWWMSVDFYFKELFILLNEYVDKKEFLIKQAPVYNIFDKKYLLHLYQSEYAYQFLKINRVPDSKILHELRGYLSKSFYDNESKIDLTAKKNWIAFNPFKGLEFTKKIIESAKNLTFIPIQNMTADEVQQLLAKSKIYIDFGNHPGRERIPREAAISHCVVVTGKQGSAGNDIDVPIPADFKFDDTEENIPNIIAKLEYILDNFQAEHDRQNSYRDFFRNEKENFFRSVSKIFKINDTPPPRKSRIALVGNVQDIQNLLPQLIHQKNVELCFVVNDELAGQSAYIKNLEIKIICKSDALFLFNERRIDKFIGR